MTPLIANRHHSEVCGEADCGQQAISPVANAAPKVDSTFSSPSHPEPLHRSARGAYELKFVVDDFRASGIRRWARQHLSPDPHAEADLIDGYTISSLYLDTPQLDIYHRSRLFNSRKFRLRRYGRESLLWLEQKQKRHGRVNKRRLAIDESNLIERLWSTPVADWEGAWFRRRLAELRLSPVTTVTYRRTARIGTVSAGPVRLTVDTDIRIAAADGWHVRPPISCSAAVLPDRQIVELKFSEFLPTLFRELIQEFDLRPTTFSKYRASVDGCQIPLPGKPNALKEA